MTRLLPFFFLIIVGLMATQLHSNELDKAYKHMTVKQKQCLKNAFERGKPFDLGWTLAAIAWEESIGGKFKLNVFDPSFGVYHIKIENALAFSKQIEDTRFNRNRIAMWLIDDFDYSSAVCISILKWWMNFHNGSWSLAVASYNGGHKPNKKYLERIKRKIKALRIACK